MGGVSIRVLLLLIILLSLSFSGAPTISTAPTISPLSPNVTNNLTATVTVTEPDGENYNVTYNWFRNGKSITLLNMPFSNGSMGTGTQTTYDFSPYLNNGTIGNITVGDINEPLFNISGRIGGYYQFDGINDFISVTDSESLDFGASDSFTITLWVKFTRLSADYLISKRTATAGYEVWLGAQGDPQFYIDGTGGTANALDSGVAINDSNWHFITAVRDVASDKAYLYVDGVIKAYEADTTTGGLANTAPLTIGTQYDFQVADFFNGSIDEVRIYNYSFSSREILMLNLTEGSRYLNDWIHFSDTILGDVWNVSAVAIDSTGLNSSISAISSGVTIGIGTNAPTISAAPTISPLSPNVTNNLTALVTVVEPDGENYNITYNWFRNGKSTTVLNMPFTNAEYTANSQISYDFSGYANNATLGYGNAGDAGDALFNNSCIIGGCYQFDGTTTHLQISDSDSIDFGASDSFTITLWVKFTQLSADYLVSKLTTAGYDVYLAAAGDPQFYIDGTGGTANALDSNTAINDGNWHFITAVRDTASDKVYLYVDGVIKAYETDTTTGSLATTSPLIIGTQADFGSTDFFNGFIDEIRIYNYSLSPKQILFLNATEGTRYVADTIHFSDTIIGDIWNVSAVAIDSNGLNGTISAISSSVTIGVGTNAPTISAAPTISPLSPNVTNNLTATVTVTEPDGENYNVTYNWFKNGKSITVLNMPFTDAEYSPNSQVSYEFSGYANNATLGYGNVGDAGDALFNNSCKIGGCYQFDGVTSHLRVTDSDSIDFGATDSFTITLWVKANGAANADYLVSKGNATARYEVWLGTPGDAQFYIDGTGGTANTVDSNIEVDNGNWYFIAAVRDVSSDKIYIYVDGVLAAYETDTTTGGLANDGSLIVGSQYDLVSGDFFNGFIDEVRIYNYSLTPKQILFLNATEGTRYVADTIHYLDTIIGDVWNVSAVAIDSNGLNGSISAISSSVTIGVGNTPPTISSLSITPSSPTSSQNISALVSYSDADGDQVNISYTWINNSISTLVLNLPFTDAEYSPNSQVSYEFSGYANNATLGYGNAGDAGDPLFNNSCKIGGCYQFDGTTTHLQVADSDSIDFGATDSFTITLWVKANGAASADYLVSKGNATARYEVWLGTPGDPQFTLDGATANTPSIDSNIEVDNGNWYFIAAVRDTAIDNITIYVDAVKKATTTDTTTGGLANDGSLIVGSQYDLTDFFNGFIDEVRIYNYSLSAEEISLINQSEGQGRSWNMTLSSRLGSGSTWQVYGIPIDSRGLNGTLVQSATVTVDAVDSTPPSLTLDFPTNISYNYANLGLNFSVDSTAAFCWYSVNSGVTNTTISSCANTTFTASQGQTLLWIYANDSANNVNTTNVSFVVDSTPPTLTLDFPTNYINLSYNTSIGINFSVSDAALDTSKCFYSLDGPSQVNIPNCLNFTINVSQGNHNISIFANDTLNNQASISVRNFTVDLTTPTLLLDFPTEGINLSYRTNIGINFSLGDNVGIDTTKCLYSLDNLATVSIASCNNFTLTVAEGRHNISIYANDTSNNQASILLRNFTADITNPTITLDYPTLGLNTTLTTLGVNYSASDSLSGLAYCNYTLDDVVRALATCANTTTPVLSAGAHRINVSATDSSGRTTTTPTVNFTVDLTAPTLLLDFPTEGINLSYRTNIGINFSLGDNVGIDTTKCLYSLDNLATVSIASCNNFSLTVAEGRHNISIYANDTSNNQASIILRNFTTDITNPTITLDYPTLGLNTTLTTLGVNYSASDSLSGLAYCNYTLDDVVRALATCANTTTPVLSAGAHRINVSATDSSGRTTTTPTVNFTVDLTTPTLLLDFPTEGINLSYRTNIGINFSLGDNVGIDTTKCLYSLDNLATVSIASCNNFTLTVAEGRHNISIYANDTSNNQASILLRNFTADITNPTITLDYPTLGLNTTLTTLGVNYSASDSLSGLAYCNYTLDDVVRALATCTNTTTPVLSAGAHRINVSATDSSGRTTTTPTVNFTVDLTAPTLLLDFPTEGINLSYRTNIGINFSLGDNVGIDTTKCLYSLDNLATVSIASCNNFSLTVAEGRHNISIYANDTSNNQASIILRNFTTDLTPPPLTLDFPTNTSYAYSNLGLNFSTNADQCWYSTNNGVTNTSLPNCANITFTASQGQTLLWVYANDSVNNVNRTNVSFVADTIYPSLTLQFPTNSTYNISTISLNYSTDAVQCWYSLNSGNTNTTIASCANTTITPASEGQKLLWLYVNDSVNNLNSTNSSFVFDVTAPNFNSTLTPADAFSSTSTSQTFTFMIFDNVSTVLNCYLNIDSLVVSTNSLVLNATETTFTSTLAVGSHTWFIGCNDSAGNLNSTATRTITITASSSGALPGGNSDPDLGKETLEPSYSVDCTGKELTVNVGENGVRLKLSPGSQYVDTSGGQALFTLSSVTTYSVSLVSPQTEYSMETLEVNIQEECTEWGEKPIEELECYENNDCKDSEYCSEAGECLSVEEGTCGEVKDHEWVDFECCTDSSCSSNEFCSENECTLVETETCGEIQNHKWYDYECCADTDCASNEYCAYNSCIVKVEPKNETTKEDAEKSVQGAKAALSIAQASLSSSEVKGEIVVKKSDLVNEADDLLDQAKKAYENGDYDLAEQLAEQSKAFSEKAKDVTELDQEDSDNKKDDNIPLYALLGTIVLLLLIVGYLFLKGKKEVKK